MRKSFVAGNWKMNKTIEEAATLATQLKTQLASNTNVDVAIIPPFLAISKIREALDQSPIMLGAQDVYFEKSGAFTGEISADMLKDAGCEFALVGHSERRHVIGESDEIIRKKLDALIAAGLKAILCVGEKLEERESNKTQDVLNVQIKAGLTGLSEDQLAQVTVAYEPVWAIGTGKTATSEQAQSAHKFIRDLVAKMFNQKSADQLRIQYGGSVKPENAKELLSQSDIDGALVGGAALSPNSFVGIIEGA